MNALRTLIISENKDFASEIHIELDSSAHEHFLVHNLEEAEEQLQQNKHSISTVVIDVSKDVYSFENQLRSLKRQDYAKHIPLIGITDTEVDDNFPGRSLFFHLLGRPLHGKNLSHTVESATAEYKRYQALLKEVSSRTSAIGLINSGTFTLQTLQQAEALTTMLSLACPDPACVALGLSELLVNAIEHGNLAITYQQKSILLENGQWDEEIKRRFTLDEYKDRIVEVHFMRHSSHIEISVKDQGDGFDWQRYINEETTVSTRKHGRGIALAVAMGFSKLEYNEKGNQAFATILL